MTIADYCADVAAATPSAACELAIPDMTSFYTRMHNYQEVLGTLLQQKLMLMYGKTALLERQLEAQRPDKKADESSAHLRAVRRQIATGNAG